MSLLNNQSIQRKLLVLVLLTSTVTLALCAAAWLGFQCHVAGADAQRTAQERAEWTVGRIAAALEAGDASSVSNILQSWKSEPGAGAPGAYVVDGNVLAMASGLQGLGGLPEGVHFERDRVTVDRLVPAKNNRVGAIHLPAEFHPVYTRVWQSALIVALAMVVALPIAVWLGLRLGRAVTRPIHQLYQNARSATSAGPLTLPEATKGVDELAQLVAGFGGLMGQLQGRETALQVAQNDLENRVAERTRELQQEILQRRRAEAALADEKERLAVTLRSIGDGVIATDRRGYTVLFNAIAEEITGWTSAEALGRPLREVLRIYNDKTRSPCNDPVEQVLRSDGPVELSENILLVARDGAERLIADSGAPIRDRQGKSIGVVLVFRDVTEKQRLADELLKASKLESIGLMAGGIAHDFNNILTSILGHVSLAKMQAPAESELADSLSTAEKSAIRARDLTRQLLAFAKGGAPVRKTASLTELIRENTSFALHGSNVRSRFSLAEDLWTAEVDAGQFSQAIQSLAIHGVRAMPAGGSLEVRAANVALSEPTWVPLAAGNYIMISIQDHGQGIAPENLAKIFDPYFSKDGGSGLGLAAAYSIIKRHDGHIAVESAPDKGTAFHVYLPATPGPAKAPVKPVPPSLESQRRILVMDDDLAIRDVAREMLETLGYEVEVAEDGTQAIERYRAARSGGQPFGAVILDLTVQGGMGGQDTIQELLRLDKNVKAIVSSGYYDDPVIARYREYGFAGVVPKPYNLDELGRVLRELFPARDQAIHSPRN